MPQNGLNPRMGRQRGVGYRRYITGGAYLNALNCDGVNDYVQVPALVATPTPDQYSIALWVCYDTLPAAGHPLELSGPAGTSTLYWQQASGNLRHTTVPLHCNQCCWWHLRGCGIIWCWWPTKPPTT